MLGASLLQQTLERSLPQFLRVSLERDCFASIDDLELFPHLFLLNLHSDKQTATTYHYARKYTKMNITWSAFSILMQSKIDNYTAMGT